MSTDLKEHIRRLALLSGACAAGFAAVEPLPEAEMLRYDRWIAGGKNASMDYLERYRDIRRDPRLLLEGARTVLCAAFSYSHPSADRHPLFADYALGQDYHTVVRRHLEQVAAAMTAAAGGVTRVCVDTAPVRERYWAVRAGIGFIGLNNMLIVPGAAGSKVFLGEIFWTGELTPDSPLERTVCDSCRRCVDACPGHALDGCGSLDARRCLSYLTIEHRGELPGDVDLSGRRIYGCDVCQDVCPHNRKTDTVASLPEFRPSAAEGGVPPRSVGEISEMTQEQFSTLFKGSAIKRVKVSGLVRNALRALEVGSDSKKQEI